MSKRMALSLALGSLLALAFASTALATHPRPDGGTPMRVPLVPAYKQCNTLGSPGPNVANNSHVPPLAFPSCTGSAGPNLNSNLLTTHATGLGGGSARLDVLCTTFAGDVPPCLANAGDQEDIKVVANATDVQCRDPVAQPNCNTAANGSDYNGKVIGRSDVRITDHSNPTVCGNATGTGCGVGTMSDIPFSIIVQCANDASTATGGTCTINTTIDALVPDAVKERQRGVIGVFSVKTMDAGADNLVDAGVGGCPPICGTGDENTAAVQGLFVP